MSCSAKRRSRSRWSIARRVSFRVPPKSTSASPSSRTMASCAPKRCCSPASCTRKRRVPTARWPCTQRYVEQFPKPVEAAVETHFKIAGIYQRKNDTTSYHRTLEKIVQIDAAAGSERTARTRFLAGGSALVLAQQVYESFASLKLLQPFEQSLEEKQRRMNVATETFGRPRRLPGRRDHGGRDVLPRRDLQRLQPRAARVGAAGRAHRREVAGIRGRARRRGVPVRREGHQGAREESRADERRPAVQQLDREESRAPRRDDAWPVREGGDQLRLPRIDRPLCVSVAGCRCGRCCCCRGNEHGECRPAEWRIQCDPPLSI